MRDQAILSVPLPQEFQLFSQGKVRDTYFIPSDIVDGQKDLLLQVTTDRISALNVKLKPGIPGRGEVLVGLTVHFARLLAERLNVKMHIVESDFDRFPEPLRRFELLRGRSLIIQRLFMIPIEAVVRFLLTGTAWKSYQETETIFGVPTESDYKQWDPLPPRLSWTPTAKSAHDEPLTPNLQAVIYHPVLTAKLREKSLDVMELIRDEANRAGFVLADGKLEWGIGSDGELTLGDEWGTPDACRFIERESFERGQPASFDKDPIRMWLDPLLRSGHPIPPIPAGLVAEICERYFDVLRRITGIELE